MKIALTDPISISAAAQQFAATKIMLRRGVLKGAIRSQRIGWLYLLEKADARRYVAERRRARRGSKS